MKNKETILKVHLWMIFAYHIVAGLAACFSQEFAVELGRQLYGVQIDLNEQTQMIIRYLGVFAITFSLMIAVVAKNPSKYRPIIYCAIGYFVIRGLQRIIFWQLMTQFSIGVFSNWIRLFFIAYFAVALFILLPKESSER